MGQYFEPRHTRQAKVEDDQVIGFAAALVHRVATIGEPVDGIALPCQPGHQLVGQGNVIFHQKQAHQSSLSLSKRPDAASRSSSRTTPSVSSSSTS
ncbi:hypothetical protein ALQ97_200149 [Pseudomonas savastanoi pv. glycinea]|nr:hypothetical protein ALQ97_200149 [Pseudomonas savastanoi pv. glycinea]